VEKVLPTSTKWKDILLDVNAVGEKASLEPISLSKLSTIKKQTLANILQKAEIINLPGVLIARS
jgi:hypothetical protein